MATLAPRFDHDLFAGDMVCLEFLNEVIKQDGNLAQGDTTAVGQLSFATDTTTQAMIDEAKAFWTNGTLETGAASPTVVIGWSAATPFESFDGYPGFGTIGSTTDNGTGVWVYDSSDANGDYVTGFNYAKGLRGWFAQAGFDAKVKEIWDYTQTFASNSDFETGALIRNQALSQATTGTFDVTLAFATLMKVRQNSAAIAENGSSLYDWGAMGLVSAIASSQIRAAFTEAKREVSEPRRREHTGRLSSIHFRPGQRGKSGLSFQVSFTETIESGTRRVFDIARAAMIGLSYREQPRIFNVTDAQ